ncbi:MAG: heavy metal translocating P-type ATPase, partial [Spirochaetota bacterium]
MFLCYHCQSETPLSQAIRAEIGGKQELFCCNGCLSVSQIIHNSQKEAFYRLRGSSSLAPISSELHYKEASINSEFTYKKFVSYTDSELAEVDIAITNIHCAACIWLLEKVVSEKEGVHSMRVSFANSKAHVVWDDSRTKLYEIITSIESIGYHPVLSSPLGEELQMNKASKDLFQRMIVAGFCFGNIMLFSAALYAGFFSGIESNFRKMLHYLSWALATPAYLYAGLPFLRGAYYALKHKVWNMDILLVFGVSLAYFYSVYVTVYDIGEVYFDSVCMIYFFVLLGKYLEMQARKKVGEQIAILLAELPETVVRLKGGTREEVLAQDVEVGDILLISPGERIPVDAELLSSTAFVDEAFLTGEARPIVKKEQNELLAGSIALQSLIKIKAKTTAYDSTLAVLKKLIENAILEKPRIQILTDRLTSYFVYLVFAVAVLTFAFWLWYGSPFVDSLVITISVLIVACPCALGLSVPIALVMHHSILAKGGILVRRSQSLEFLAKPDTIVFDKTGTLTQGNFKVSKENVSSQKIKQLVSIVESNSTHPIARSLLAHLQE